MRRRILSSLCLIAVILAGCTALVGREPSVPPTFTPEPTSTSAQLGVSTGGLPDAAGLLDGVCFEYLYGLGGATLVWNTADEQRAFYDAADASGVCASPAARPAFDFSAQIVAGTVSAIAGCDAAHHLVALEHDDAARRVTLRLALEVRAGCPYELVEPFLVALPRPPAGYAVEVAVSGR
ncbi:MAG: hypothetical protein KJ047_15150 [Anaerolineae bacterium]|nr:hypothetical protein [Anaerolineae bacterium]